MSDQSISRRTVVLSRYEEPTSVHVDVRVAYADRRKADAKVFLEAPPGLWLEDSEVRALVLALLEADGEADAFYWAHTSDPSAEAVERWRSLRAGADR